VETKNENFEIFLEPQFHNFVILCVCVCGWQYHPDANKQPGAEQKFKEISTAYEVCLSSSSPATNPLS
jgi:hypothetical protein